ncbi:MAG: hypothetical protein FWC10_06270 [Lentimicrobiaceae bacterium]|nr:hypothetical protein [Lentimicrobiaceae bacterium]
MKKLFLFTFFLIILLLNGYNQNNSFVSSDAKSFFESFKKLTQQQLFDTAKHYHNKYSIDTALICYSLIINDSVSTDLEYNRRMVYALNNSAVIYMNICDYHNAYKLLLDALLLCEKHNIVLKNSPIYGNLGNIYFNFKKLDIAQSYYEKGLGNPSLYELKALA